MKTGMTCVVDFVCREFGMARAKASLLAFGVMLLAVSAKAQVPAVAVYLSDSPTGGAYTSYQTVEGGTSGWNTAYLVFWHNWPGFAYNVPVQYSLSGSTASSSDYTPTLSGSITIPAGTNLVSIAVKSLLDANVESTENLIVTLTAQPAYYTIYAGYGSTTNQILDDTPRVHVYSTNAIFKEGLTTALVFERTNAYTVSAPCTNKYSVSGTAGNGTDYSPTLSGTAITPAGNNYVLVPLTGTGDTLLEGAETVTVTLTSGTYSIISGEGSTTLTLQDDYSTVNVEATDNYASEASGDTGIFTLTRDGNTNKAITVQVSYTGTAVAGTDYTTLATNITFAVGQVKTNLVVTPITNGVTEAAETVVLNLLTNSTYLLGLNTNAVVTITGEGANARDSYPKGERYMRGSGTNIGYYSIVVPLDDLKGTRRDDVEFYGYNYGYHYNATNTGNQAYSSNRLAFNTPIASFGSAWGTPLYIGQSYWLGVYAGTPTTDPLAISIYDRNSGAWITNLLLTIPDIGNSTDWVNFVTNGFSRTISGYGLTTVIRDWPGVTWGTGVGGFLLTHTASDASTNYYYMVLAGGTMNGIYAALDASNQPKYGYFYELTFDQRPGWRSVFIDQPHFQTDPLPPDLWNKTPDELFNYGVAVTNTVSLSPSTCTNLDQSPELRRHPTLDQFVSDLNNDPLALANYVQNEIELTDPIAYRDDGSVATESVNQGGVNRGAVGVYLEGRGSPVEQCALLIYLLRQAGYPATYVFPPEGGMKMLDTRLSALLRMRINDGVDNQGRSYTTNRLITVNYPWVATYISNQWVHVFPWIKDTSVEEGLDIYDYLPDPYRDTQLWVRDYVLGKTNITAFATADDDTPGTVFPRFLDNALKQNAPGISVDDIGMRYVNRRHLYAQWSDFPRPTWTTNSSTAVESLASSGITNVSPRLTNIFDTIQIELFSVNNPQKKIATAEMRMADLHNRKFYLSHTNLGSGQVQAVLTLGAYRPSASGQGTFSASDTTLTNKQVLTLTLDGTDDNLKLRLRHRRQKALTWETAIDPDRAFLDMDATRDVSQERPLRKGDVAGICFNTGRVTPAMLRVHAQELWNMEQMLSTNSVATNQVSADVYQGSLVYLMGMSYYERTARFEEVNRQLYKAQNLSTFAMGLAKISPRRDTDGTLYNSAVDPIWPNVDMFYREVVTAGNGTVRLDSGWSRAAATRNYLNLSIANISAQEHAVLNRFYGQSNSVSTVKLLQLAQSKVGSGGSNVVELNYYNYVTEGNKVYGGKALKDHDASMWAQVVNIFEQGGSQGYVVAWLTPGTQTTASGSFSGMGALVLGVDYYTALIGNNQYGAFGDRFGYNTIGFSTLNTWNTWLLPNGDVRQTFLDPTPSTWQPAWESSPTFNYTSDFGLLNSGSLFANPYQNTLGTVNNLLLYNTPGSYLSSYTPTLDLGTLGNVNFNEGNGFTGWLADPVNSLSGEFYVDEVDLSLPGPMPLQVRRNYSSQNLAANQLGYGWKLNYMPYLTVAPSNNVIYAAEPSGSVLAFGLVSSNLWAPTAALNPELNNYTENGIGSAANYFNARLAKATVGSTNYYYLTNGDGSFRVFQEMSFPLTNSTSWDRLRPYLTTWYDNRGNFYRFEYGTNAAAADYGQVRRIASSSGNVVRFLYDVNARVVEAYSLDGRRVQYDYDDHGDLVTVTRPDSSELHYEYQLATWTTNSIANIYSTHLITRELKPDGRVLKNEYDDQRRVTNQWATVGPDLRLVRNATFRYTNNFTLTNITGTLTGTTTILDYTNSPTTFYYTNGLIRRIRDALGSEQRQEWYEANETNAPAYPRSLKTMTDKRGLVTSYFYDSRGNLTNTTVRGDLLGDGNTNTTAISTAVYDPNNLPVQTVDPSGTTNLFFYTNTWRLARIESWPSNATQAIINLYAYATVTNAADGTVSYGLRVREIRAAGSPDAATNEWAYSSRGFPTQQTRYSGTGDPAVSVTNLYNYRGELAQQTDTAGRMTRFGFDPLGRPQSSEVFDAGQSAPMAWDFSYYNENGELTWTDGSRFDPEDYVWRDYDGAGRKTQEIRWRSRGKIDGSGVEAETGDDLYATTFNEYDPFNNLTKTTDPLGNYSLKRYDVLGQLTREEFYNSSGALLSTNGFRYNAAGDVTNAFNALGGAVEKQYTSNGKPKFQRNADGSTNGWLYYTDGRVRRETQSNGAYWESTYDDANRKTTRIFYSATGTSLATNIAELDRRGNLVKRTDAAGNVFTNLFDGLDRLKVSSGPAIATVSENCQVPGCGVYVTNILQQSVTNFFDAAGVWQTNVNILGEQTSTRFDALRRAIRTEIRAASGTLVREATTVYATNQHSATITEGSGASAISTTTYTDNDGHTVLSIRYPASGYLDYTWQRYDRGGRRVESQQLSKAGAASPYLWSFGLWDYDGLNRVKTETARDYAATTYDYDAMGNLTNRTMPGGLKWTAVYNSAGQMLQERNVGGGGTATRTNTYVYYAAGSAFAGLLQTSTDGRNVACTHYYDDWLRPASNSYSGSLPEHNLACSWQYDARGLMTSAAESFASGSVTPATVVTRGYDPYAQLGGEGITLGGAGFSGVGLTWDAAGRRTSLNFGTANFGFGWRADGALASVTGPGGSGVYNFDTAGVLTSRSIGGRTSTVSSRDGTGRPLQVDTDIYGTTVLNDALSWFLNGQLASHTIYRWDYTDSRSYAYNTYSRRLSQEQLSVTASQRWTNNFTYDSGAGGGIGVLTKAGQIAGSTWTGGVDLFSRVSAETNTVLRRIAYGNVNGKAALTGTLDGQPVSVGVTGTNGGEWRATMNLTPGTHQLVVQAAHPSGLFTTNATSWFTNTASGGDRMNDSYDAMGQPSQRVWVKANGTTNRIQTLSWDAKGRLWKIAERDTNNSGFDWTAAYDAFNRRLQTVTITVSNGVALNSQPKTINSFYDPLVEFLEVGVNYDNQTTWKQFGPDLSGYYGGMQGVGGLEAVQRGLTAPVVLVSDALGNVHEQYDTGNGNFTWSGVRHTAYGAVPGHEPVALGYGGTFTESFAWRGRTKDITGLYWIGERYYEPESGRWLSFDPVWNLADASGYSFCGGDPLNVGDWNGRWGREQVTYSHQLADTGNVGNQFLGMAYGLVGALAQIPDGIGRTFEGASASMAQANQEISTYTGVQALLANTLRVPANFAYGVTALINDPFNTVPQIPGAVAQIPGNVIQNGQSFYNNPSFYSAFNLVENGVQIAGLYEGGVSLYRAGAATLAPETGFAYRAIDPRYAQSTIESGQFFQSGSPGRLGNDGIYANTTIQGAVAEFQYHNPGVNPAVFGVEYPTGPTLRINPPSGYFDQPLPFTQDANILTAPSVRAPGTQNLLIRQGAVPAGRVQ